MPRVPCAAEDDVGAGVPSGTCPLSSLPRVETGGNSRGLASGSDDISELVVIINATQIHT